MGALLGGPWPTQNFGRVGHNAFGPNNIWFRNVTFFSLNIITRNDEKCSISVKQVSTLDIVYWGLAAVITRVDSSLN